MDILASMRSLGHRYRALWVGQALAQFGTYVAFFSIPLLIEYINKDSSTLEYALAYALENIPIVLTGLVGGVLLDRWHLRPIIVATHLIRASAFFYLSATADAGLEVSTVFAIAFIIGTMSTMFDGALYALVPNLVRKDQLPRANSLITATIQANFAIAPLIAGILTAVFASPEIGLFLTGLLFVGAAISMRGVGRVAHHRSPTDTRSPFFTEAANGIRYVWAEPRLRLTTIAAASANLVMGFIEGTWLVLFRDVIGAQTPTQRGLLLSVMGVGGVMGAFLAPSFSRRLGLGKALVVGMAITGVGMYAFMYTTFGLVAILLQIFWMAGVSIVNVPIATIRQIYASPSMLGRVITASRAIGWVTIPLGAVIGGALGTTDDTYRWVARAFPILLMATALWLFTTVIWSDTVGPSDGEEAPLEPDELQQEGLEVDIEIDLDEHKE